MPTVATARPADICPGGCPHPRATREEIMRVARREITPDDVRGSTFAPWYAPFWVAEQRVLARAQAKTLGRAAHSAETTRLARLEQRVGKLEAVLLGRNSPLPTAIGKQIGKAIAALRKEIATMNHGSLYDAGIWSANRGYAPGALVSDKGAAWICTRVTTGERPGTGDGWRLAAKSDTADLRRMVREELARSSTGYQTPAMTAEK